MEQQFLCYLTFTDGPWRIRVDKQLGDGRHHQKHVHVTRKGLKGEYSWNVDGTRHDKGGFPASEKQIQKARELASEALGIPEASLQLILQEEGGYFVSVLSLEDSTDRGRRMFSMYVRVGELTIMLGTPKGGIAILIVTA